MYTFQVSKRKDKKYDAFKNGQYLVSFGSKNFQHYDTLIKLDSTLI